MRLPIRPPLPLLFSLAALVAMAPSGLAQTTGSTDPATAAVEPRAASLFSTDYVRQLWHDTGAILTDPLRWDASDWETAGLWTAATLGTSAFDRNIRHEAQTRYRSPGNDRFFREYQKLGMQYAWVEMAAFEAWGVWRDDARARDTAMDSVSATIIAGGIITPVLKYSVGRYRPSETTRTYKFRPFSGHQSFPSGHATQAFAIATVIAGHYTEPWQQALAYGSAALVGVARIQENGHFASDVVAGAAIGWAVGRAIVHRHPLPGGYTLVPWVGDGGGLLLVKSF